MQESHIVVVGGGFAGLWAAAAAAAAGTERTERPVAVTLVTPATSLSIRPRLYEAELEPTLVELGPILEPVGVQLHTATATRIDHRTRTIRTDDGETLRFDAAVVAVGSSSPLPAVSGLAEHAHRIDVHHRAAAFRTALADARSRSTEVRVTVVGGGLTGIELATELASDPGVNVTLVDGGAVGQPFGEATGDIIRGALIHLAVEIIDGERVVAVSSDSATLSAGRTVDHDLLVWCGGLRANQLHGLETFAHDELGRLVVDPYLRLAGDVPVWAAGDSARFRFDGEHIAPMSCQFAIPAGRWAGFNAAANVAGGQPVEFAVDRYVTCVDLGRAGAVFTRGWDRVPMLTGAEGKRMKSYINRTEIYPPTDPVELLRSARPIEAGHSGVSRDRSGIDELRSAPDPLLAGRGTAR